MKRRGCRGLLLGLLAVPGCIPPPAEPARVPSVEYARKAKWDYAKTDPAYRNKLIQEEGFSSPRVANPVFSAATPERARLQFVQSAPQPDGGVEPQGGGSQQAIIEPVRDESLKVVSNLDVHGKIEPEPSKQGYTVYENTAPNTRDYNGPLSLGDPGLSASLWRESRGASALFRDVRAWQSMDLITIIVSENSDAKKEADTNVKSESTISAALSSLLGLESTIKDRNPQVDLDNLVSATTSSEFKGEGDTSRKGTLKARISAMVSEVLPSGILRIEGEKIISVNSEDEVFVISGLVRPEDVNSANEVDSSKVANMRIDFYGRGAVGDAQSGGWFGRAMRRLWPF